ISAPNDDAKTKEAAAKIDNQRIDRITIRRVEMSRSERRFRRRVAAVARPADDASAVPQRSVARPDCADRSDQERIRSFRKATDVLEFPRVRRFLRDRVP